MCLLDSTPFVCLKAFKAKKNSIKSCQTISAKDIKT